jgi:7-carboxy-7-deazaguanine synthase (Cx14CxxC type)
MTYGVKEIFYTLQGEGANTGRPAVFCRFAGCNLWTGRESDRASAACKFCDTDFVGFDGTAGGKYGTAEELAGRIARHWPEGIPAGRFVVLTGGEPALQLDPALLDALHRDGFEIAIETNGTLELPAGIDWVCVSPKAGTDIKVRSGNELKLVFPQDGLSPRDFEGWSFEHFLLQPMDGAQRARNTERAVAYCMNNPKWKLSLQTHKMLGIR